MPSSTANQFAKFGNLVLFLFAVGAFTAQLSAQEFSSLHDGVEYAEVAREIAGQPVRMNLLRLDLSKVRLDVQHARDAAIGTETTSSIATRHGAIAAVNAGFFRLDTSIWAGDSVGILMINREELSEPTSKRIALFIDNRVDQTYVSIDHLETRSWVEIKGRVLTIDGINRERKENEIVEYTRRFNPSTLTSPGGLEVIVKDGRIKEINEGRGSSEIPFGGYVLSVSGTKRDNVRKWIKIGDKVKFFTAVSSNLAIPNSTPPPPYGFEDITNGVPQLIKNGKVDITWQEEKTSKAFVETRHPRTAVAKLKDGKFLMITVDGRSESSGGIGLYDLANLLLEFGATDAMNLDGGGSTTMFLDGKVVNHPSDKEGERKVSDAIVVTLRNNAKR
jgi:hypothetical protein